MFRIACILLFVGSVLGQDYGFDYFVLVRQWGPTFCKSTNCNTPGVSLFTIHGLWPNYFSGSFPADCAPSNKYSNNLSKTLVNQMSCEWVSYTGSNAGFWSYEWSKHGTCSLALLSQQEYFEAAIDLNNQYEPNEALAAAGIDLADLSSVSATQIEDTLADAWGVSPLLSCSSNAVFELYLCIDTNLKAIECPSTLRYPDCRGTTATVPAGEGLPTVCSQYYGPSSSSPSPSSPGTPSGTPPTPNSAATSTMGAAGLVAVLAALIVTAL